MGKKKAQLIGLQFFDNSFRENHAIFLCCLESNENKCEDTDYFCKDVQLEINEIGLLGANGIGTQDLDALKVSERLKFNEAEGCDVRDGNEIGTSTIVELTKTKKS